jgi:hypothetical protein
MRALVIASCLFWMMPSVLAQNWKQVHKADEMKWAKATGLDPLIIHKLWRAASNDPDEKDDDSRIANLDVEGLAVRHDVLLVTYAGEEICLTMTVFRLFSQTKFEKVWSVDQTPDGASFCDAASGTAQAEALDGAVIVRVPRSATDGVSGYAVYRYEWNGITYRFTGQKGVEER